MVYALDGGAAAARTVAPSQQPTGTNALDFQKAVTTAQAATTSLTPNSGSQAISTVYKDWADVEAIVANQYRSAWSSSDPQKAVAALDKQYAGYFQNQGLSSQFYNGVVASARAQEEPTGSPTQTADLAAANSALSNANLDAMLQYKFGSGNNGVYTASQIQAAAADLGSMPDWKISQTLNDAASGNGSPESAANGAEAALGLLSTTNPYFYNHLLFRTDAGYSPDDAKAQAFAATLSDYEQKGDTADIAQLLNTLGPGQTAQLFAEAGNLQGPQYNASGSVFAKDQTGVDQVLGKALLTPGVQLGDGTQQGTLAYSLVHPQSGSDAAAIAGILNQSGTSPQAEALKQAFLNQVEANANALGNPNSFDGTEYRQAAITVTSGDPALLSQYNDLIATQGVFGSDASVPAPDSRFLKGMAQEIDTNLYGLGGQSNNGPATGSINQNTMYDIQQYLSGAIGGNETSAQRLSNMMSVLGPSRTYAVLADMTATQAQQAGIQSSLNTLVETGQFTGGDAKALALAQADFATSQTQSDPMGAAQVASFIQSLPNDQFGTAVKAGYAEGSVIGAQQLAQEIASGKYSGSTKDNLIRALNGLVENAANVSAGAPGPVDLQLFSQLRTMADQFASAGNGNESDVLNALAANVLGSVSDKSQIAATLRAMGGVGADGAIDPNSALAKFLQSALRGQAEFGIGMPFSNVTPSGQVPQGVTSLLNGLSGSGDTKLMAGTLDTVMQWTIQNPTQAEVLAAQDTKDDGGTGYRNALTTLLDKSFNQFVALDPSDPSATVVRTMQPQTIADLEAMSAVEMGPPYDGNIAGNFAGVIGKHAVQFAAYAENAAKYPELDSLLASGGDPRNSAAVIFGQVMNAFDNGLNRSQAAFQTQATNSDLAATIKSQETRIVTDFLRGAGTGLLLASAWVTGGTDIPIGLGVAATGRELLSVFGRIGLFSGSIGTAILDIGELGNQDTEQSAQQAVSQGMQAADLTPTQVLQQLYNGWFSTISQLPGGEGQTITDGVMNGSSFAGAPAIDTAVPQSFYNAYNPLGYYHNLTGQYPSVS
jgi:hypothetical protein